MAKQTTAASVVTAIAAALALGLAWRAGAQVPPFAQCPPVGVDTSCELLIVASATGSFTVLFDPTQPGFAGDDTLVGVQNDSSLTITQLSISGDTDIFGFDFDGLCSSFPAPAGCPFGPTGYEGPGVSFVNFSSFGTSGLVRFTPGIPPGGSTYFSLEEDVHTLSVGTCGNGVVEPGELCDDGARNGTAASCCPTTCTSPCDDGNGCTDDVCDSSGGTFVCSHVDNTAPCQSTNACFVGGTCSGGTCQGSVPRDCNDFNPCTDDLCDSSTGCFVRSNNNPCNDFNPCTDNDRCNFGFCQGGTFNNVPCNDGNACTVNDHCSFGFCQGGAPLDCDDGNPCTSEFCNFFSGCQYTKLDGIKCEDHNPCTTDDVCHDGVCTGDARNCLDDDPCTIDACNSAGGAFLCQHESCTSIPGSCPAQCVPPGCGNGRIDPGETCDPPDPTPVPGRPGDVKCRPDCTFCGDGVVQGGHGETCDDGNLLSGCTPGRPNVPLDGCQNVCTAAICRAPSMIRLTGSKNAFTMRGWISPIAPAMAIDPRREAFVVELTDADGAVVFRSSLDAGAIQAKGSGFAFSNAAARLNGGIGKLKLLSRGGEYVVSVSAYGDLSAAADRMTTHLFIGSQEWTLAGRWVQKGNGWRLDLPSTFQGS